MIFANLSSPKECLTTVTALHSGFAASYQQYPRLGNDCGHTEKRCLSKLVTKLKKNGGIKNILSIMVG